MKRELKIFDTRRNVDRLLLFFAVALVGLLVADFFVEKHGHFAWENAPVFYAAYGFICYLALIVLAKGLRLLLKRGEDYYDK